MPKRDPMNEKFDAILRDLERAMVDLKLARRGDRSPARLSIISDSLHDATMAMYGLMKDLRAAQEKAKREACLRLPAPVIVQRHVTPVAKRLSLPGAGESIFD